MSQGFPKISIVIPVYNGEKYIGKTLDSIIAQHLHEFEVICVDDCSSDGSAEIIKSYEKRDSRIRFMATGKNLGNAPKVINRALPQIRGEYYVYSSQDDLFSVDWLSSMYRRAVEVNADAVIPRLFYYYENEPEKIRESLKYQGDRNSVIDGKEAFVHSLDWTIPGHVLWRTSIVKESGYSEFSMNADEYSVRRNYLKCNVVAFAEGVFYYRQDNMNAITKKMSIKKFDVPVTEYKLWELAKNNNMPADVQYRLLVSSILSLISYRSMSHMREYTKGAEIVGRCYEVYDRKKTGVFFRDNKKSNYKYYICKYSVKYRFVFELISWFRFMQKSLLV